MPKTIIKKQQRPKMPAECQGKRTYSSPSFLRPGKGVSIRACGSKAKDEKLKFKAQP
jgi:hypothetical protein